MLHKIPERPYESVGVDIFTITNKHYLYIVHYQNKLPIEQLECFGTDILIKICEIVSSEYELLSK